MIRLETHDSERAGLVRRHRNGWERSSEPGSGPGPPLVTAGDCPMWFRNA